MAEVTERKMLPSERIEREIFERHGKLMLEKVLTKTRTFQLWLLNGHTFVIIKHDGGGYELFKGTTSNLIQDDIVYLDELRAA